VRRPRAQRPRGACRSSAASRLGAARRWPRSVSSSGRDLAMQTGFTPRRRRCKHGRHAALVLETTRKPLVVRDMPDPRVSSGQRGRPRRGQNDPAGPKLASLGGRLGWSGSPSPRPAVMGHEFCGVIEVGRGHPVEEGRPGPGAVQPGRGHLRGVVPRRPSEHLRHATRSASRTGEGFGRLVGIPHADVNLVPLPESVAFTDAASMGCATRRRSTPSSTRRTSGRRVGGMHAAAASGCRRCRSPPR
jgi:hypothetical protein